MTVNLEYPRLRHCTFVERNDSNNVLMILGTDYYELGQELGSLDQFFHVKRYFDGRHSVSEISKNTGVPENDIREIVNSFAELGLLRKEEEIDLVPTDKFVKRVQDSCVMWGRQIGYHRLFGSLERGEVRKEVFVGLILETYHYVKSVTKHVSVALENCSDPYFTELLTEYFVEEYDHAELILQALMNLGLPREQVETAHPIIGTMSLINMLCEIGRQDTLSYIACTALFEARKEDFEEAKNSLERICSNFGYDPKAIEPVVEHMRGDVMAGHNSLLSEALKNKKYITREQAHFAVNCLHDLKHSFDQFHDQILQYYSDISNYIPRLKVDYFSL